MPITLSPAAVERVRRFATEHADAIGMRLGVKRTGCSGWGYEVDLARAVGDDDSVFEQDGVKVVVDARSLALIDGTEVDFVRRGLNQEFVFRNPNAAGECGCGESFTTEAA
jgi:iron-sulfur cluster assembly protein